MRILILDYSGSLLSLADKHTRIKLEAEEARSPTAIIDSAARLKDPFVLVWHRDAGRAIELVKALDVNWPDNLCGCVFFSGEPNANAMAAYENLEQFEAAKQRIPAPRRNFVHFFKPGVPKNLSADEHPYVWRVLKSFVDYVLDRDHLGPVSFSLLEPHAESNSVSSEAIRARIQHLTSSDGRLTKSSPTAVDCPFCPMRGAIHHDLQRILRKEGYDPLEVLQLLASERGKLLYKEVLRAAGQRDHFITDLFEKTGFNARAVSWPKRKKKLEAMAEAVFESCTIVNIERADKTLGLWDQIQEDGAAALELSKMLPEFQKALECLSRAEQKETSVAE